MLDPRAGGRQETCRTKPTRVYSVSVKHDKKVDVRLPSELHDALEAERLRMSRIAGVEVKTSAVIRAILKKKLLPKRSARAA